MISITTAYNGEVLDGILTRAMTGNEVVDGGHIRIIPNVESKIAIPRMKLGQIIQDRKATPVSGDSQGTFTLDERSLVVDDYMIYLEFNPRDFETYWRPYQPTGNLVFRELPPAIQVQMAELILAKIDEYHGEAIWTNDKASGVAPFDKFDGILTIAAAAAGTIKIASPVALTNANVKDKFDLVHKAVPRAVKKNASLKYFCSPYTQELYEEYLMSLPYKSIDPTMTAPTRYRGKTIVPLNGFPDDCIFAAVANSTASSNLHMGVALQNDENVLIVDRLQANSEMFFFKMLVKGGTQIGWPEETVLYMV
jgi:hypothetical protein